VASGAALRRRVTQATVSVVRERKVDRMYVFQFWGRGRNRAQRDTAPATEQPGAFPIRASSALTGITILGEVTAQGEHWARHNRGATGSSKDSPKEKVRHGHRRSPG